MIEPLRSVIRLVGVSQLPTSGGYPQTDGMVERLNRTLKQMLTKVVLKGGCDWDTLLDPVLFAYRTTPHSSTGESPFYLIYGRDACIPSSMSFGPSVVNCYTRETEYGRSLFSRTADCKKYSPRSIREAQQKQKKNYDKSAIASHLSA